MARDTASAFFKSVSRLEKHSSAKTYTLLVAELSESGTCFNRSTTVFLVLSSWLKTSVIMSIAHVFMSSESMNGFLDLARFHETRNDAAVALSCAEVNLLIVDTEFSYDFIINSIFSLRLSVVGYLALHLHA